jgi:hypothetical protein
MKKGVLFLGLVLVGFLLMSFVSANSYCGTDGTPTSCDHNGYCAAAGLTSSGCTETDCCFNDADNCICKISCSINDCGSGYMGYPGSTCTKQCLDPATVGCAESLNNGCRTGCGVKVCGTCTGGIRANIGSNCNADCADNIAVTYCGKYSSASGCGSCVGTCCDTGQVCSGGVCVAACSPNCAGKQCGDNGCGGSCGSCSSDLISSNEGNYEINNPSQWINSAASKAIWTYDNDWNTYGSASNHNTDFITVNYTKLTGALPSSVLQIKTGQGMVDLPIPSSCWNALPNKLYFIVRSSNSYVQPGPDITAVNVSCFEGTSEGQTDTSRWYREMRVISGTSLIYEENMAWRIPNPNPTTCVNSQCVPTTAINKTSWTNLKGDIISTSQVGDTVRMLAGGFGLTSAINYTVYKTSGFWIFRWATLVAATSASALWTSDEIANGVYFIARLGSITNTSSTLNIGAGGPDTNSMPIANITGPANYYMTSVNFPTPVPFTQASYDEDDMLNLAWNFGDGNTTQFTNYSLVLTPSLANTNHIYSTAGTYNVILTATELTRGQVARDYRTIIVLQPGMNVIALINSPNLGTSYGNWVNFNASLSFVANCSASMPNYNFTAGALQCKYVHAPLTRTITGNYDLRLNWTVYDSAGIKEPTFPRIGSWKTNYSYIVDYPIYFEEAKKRNAVLRMTYS